MQINAQLVLVAMVAGSTAAAPIKLPSFGRNKAADGAAAPAAGGAAPAAAAAKPGFYDVYDKHGSKINAVGALTAGGMAIGAGTLAHEASQANDAAAAATAAQQPAAADPAAAVRRAGPHRSGSVSSGHTGGSSPGGSVYGTPMGSPMNSRPGSPVNGQPAAAAAPAAPAAPAAGIASTEDAAAKAAQAKTKNGAINNMMGTAGAAAGIIGGGVALNNAMESNNAAQDKNAAAQAAGADPAANVRRSPLTPLNIAAQMGMGMAMGGGGVSVNNDKQSYTQQFMSQGAKHTGASSRRSEDGDLLGKRLIPISTSSTKYSQVSQGLEQGPSHTGASSGGGSSATFFSSGGGSAMPMRREPLTPLNIAAQMGMGMAMGGAGGGINVNNDKQSYTQQFMSQGAKHTGASSRRSEDGDLLGKRLIPISVSKSKTEQVSQGLEQGPSHTGASSGGGSSSTFFQSGGGSAMPMRQQQMMAKRLIPISTSSSKSEQVAQGLQQGPSHTGATSGSNSAGFLQSSSAMPPGQGSGMVSSLKYGGVQQQRRDASMLFGR